MRWTILLTLALLGLGICAGCAEDTNRGGLRQTDGGWNSREKSVPGQESYYGIVRQRDDDN